MINFFRKIRHGLLTENKFSKYLLYAIGEIILVVIGILIAVQINYWNTERKNEAKEIIIMNELKKEYTEKLTELNQKDNIRDIMFKSCNKILDIINSQNFEISADSLNILISGVLYTPTYDAPNSVTSELINSGNIYLIRNKQLRKLIVDWEGNLGKLIEEEQAVINTITNGLHPYLWNSYPLKNVVINKFSPDNKIRKNISKSSNTISFSTTKSNKIVNVEKLLSDLMFENLLSTVNIGIISSINQSNDLRKNIDGVLAIIDSDIKK